MLTFLTEARISEFDSNVINCGNGLYSLVGANQCTFKNDTNYRLQTYAPDKYSSPQSQVNASETFIAHLVKGINMFEEFMIANDISQATSSAIQMQIKFIKSQISIMSKTYDTYSNEQQAKYF